MRSPIVTLTSAQVEIAAEVARRRVENVVRHQRKAVNGQPMDPATVMRRHVTGARGEIAARQWLAPISWNIEGKITEPDLGDVIDVKTGERATDHLLLIRERTRAHWIYLLARGHDHPRWQMVGWIDGASALAQPSWVRAPNKDRPCIVVPHKALAPLQELWDYVENWMPADRSGAGAT